MSPDGSQIVFISDRDGTSNVWECVGDGSKPVQLTNFERFCGSPHWSPDGKAILFDSLQSGNWDLWSIASEGGVPRQVTTDPTDENYGTWSRDGRWIYFTSTQGDQWEVYKMPAEGGERIPVASGGWWATESMDGQYLYYEKPAETGLWRLRVDGTGQEEQILSEVRGAQWAIGERGIYFARSMRLDYRIQFLDLETGETREVYRRQGPFDHGNDFSVSPDEQWLLFSEWPSPTSELMMAEDFH